MSYDSLISTLVSTLKVGITLVLLAILGWQVIGDAPPRPDSGRTPPAETGDSVPELRVTMIAGEADTARLSDLVDRGCHLVYFFDPSCPACRDAARDWRTHGKGPFVDSPIGMRWVSISASSDSTAAFVHRYDLPDSTLIVTDDPGLGNVGIGAIPGVWGTVDRRIATRRTGISATSPTALSADLSWCPAEAR